MNEQLQETLTFFAAMLGAGEDYAAFGASDAANPVLRMSYDAYERLGRPVSITVTVEPTP
jgi:hypothetical protein